MSEPPNEMLARMRAHAGTAYILALGAEVTLAEPGKATMRLPYSQKIVGNPDTGVVHGGVITGLLDHACGMAVGSALGEVILEPGRRAVTSYATLDLRIDYMKAARPGADILVAAECVKITRQIVFARGCAYQDTVDDPIAMATGTFILTELRSGGIMTEQRPGS
jgi:uncharacterized protein (TIGR00369 family)